MLKRRVGFDDADYDNGEELESEEEEELSSTSEDESGEEGSAEEGADDEESKTAALDLSDLSDDEDGYDAVEADNQEELRLKSERQREDMNLMLSSFSEEQLRRYETFRRSNFSKGPMKKFIQSIIDQPVNPNMLIAINGIAKVFVGELVEESRKVSQLWNNDDGPLMPSHVFEAYRRMKEDRVVPRSSLYRNDVRYY